MRGTGRLEAFSDGVLAIVITIMVLEMKVPEGADLVSLRPLLPVLLSYVLSFVYIGIYWNNHHHLLRAAERVDGAVLWANLHLLFWLSLTPFVTGWMGENQFAPTPTALYGGVLLLAAFSYRILQRAVLAGQSEESMLGQSIGRDVKGKASPVLYVIGIVVALWRPWLAGVLYTAVALMWLIPDRRIERAVRKGGDPSGAPTGSSGS